MKTLYSEATFSVPDNLTKASSKFKKQVAFAIFGLLLFVIMYFGLMIWFAKISYDQFASLGPANENSLKTVITGVAVGVLAFFMLKSLFNFSKKEKGKLNYLNKEEEPLLFDFINKLADEAGAPRPHKIMLSPRVNASVFYDLSIFNLLIPSKKNLEIGLGLVNVLNLGEFKAVLAHEFGHFAQRSMLFGRYVYIANQIATRVVNKRDALDDFLRGISSIDIRIAWIGWILSILVWAIRSLIEVLFSVVVIAERALSREMEFQADLVSVSLTGSDSLINGLHKLRGADEAFNSSISILNDLIGEQKRIPDLYVLQTNYIERMRGVLNDASFGGTPQGFREGQKSKIFKVTGVNPPEMWSTHPADEDREENAKRIYIPSQTDNRSSWELFQDPIARRQKVTKEIYDSVDKLPDCESISNEEATEKMDAQIFDWPFLDDRYKGLFFEHHMTLYVETEVDLISGESQTDLIEEFKTLYPDSIKRDLEIMRDLTVEMNQLEATKNEVITSERRAIYYRGDRIARRQIPNLIIEIQNEIKVVESRISAHDKKCRLVHHLAAKKLGLNYSDFHAKLLLMLHYAEHSWYNITDLLLKFQNSLSIASAGGRSTSDQMRLLITDANRLGAAIEKSFDEAEEVIELGLSNKQFEQKSYKDRFEKFGLGTADNQNINVWIQNLEGWFGLAQSNLWALRNATLGRLITFEREIEQAYKNQKQPVLQLAELKVPERYSILTKGSERKTPFKLSLWDRFLAGYGLIPMILKFIVSAAMIIGVIALSGFNQNFKLYIYNGLETEVNVSLDGAQYTLSPDIYQEIEIDKGVHQVATTNKNGDQIESFEAEVDGESRNYIYNIANGAYLLEYTVSYGYDAEFDNKLIGGERWYATNADYIFTDAPGSLSLRKRSTATKTVLISYPFTSPYYLPLDFESSDAEKMVFNHSKWDDYGSPYLYDWMQLSSFTGGAIAFFEEREAMNGFEVGAKRIQMDLYDSDTRMQFCNEFEEAFAADTSNGDYFYLKTRCEPDGKEQNEHFLAGHKKWPKHPWLGYAATYKYAEIEDWDLAIKTFSLAQESDPSMVHYAGSMVERIRRIVDPDLSHIEYNYINDNASVSYMRSLEEGEYDILIDNPDERFYNLSQGDLASVEIAMEKYEVQDEMTYYLAASQGIQSEYESVVLDWDNERGITENTIWMAIALRMKNGIAYAGLVEKIPEYMGEGFDIENFNSFLIALKAGRLKASNQQFAQIDNFINKAYVALVGVIFLGEKAPENWKLYVSKLLYINEKPYFNFELN